MPSRAEHVEWCKQRALEYVDAGDAKNALASLNSDLSKHPETREHQALELGAMLMLNGHLSTLSECGRDMRRNDTKAATAPGTVNYGARGRCQTCYRRVLLTGADG